MKKHKKARLLTMDELQARPCEADGVPALFHRWVEEDEVYIRQNFSFNTLRKTYALVEYRDGTVHKVAPELITFTDKEARAWHD